MYLFVIQVPNQEGVAYRVTPEGGGLCHSVLLLPGNGYLLLRNGASSYRGLGQTVYARDAVKGSILKIEDDNRDPKTGDQRQLYCLAISAKRYALFVKDRNGTPTLLREGKNNKKDDRWSEHGLGHLLNPTDPEGEDRDWIGQAWLAIVRKTLGLPTQNPTFGGRPAVGRTTVSSPAVMRPLANLNEGRSYADKIKPFNVLLACHVKAFGHPPGVNPERFHLIAPYEPDSRKWLKKNWIDQYSGKEYRITTAGHHGDRHTARVKTYGDVLLEYEYHPESKYADAAGKPCGKQTVGRLQRRHVRIDQIKYIGKESNSLEEVEAGLQHSSENVYTEYTDPRRDEWATKIRPALKDFPPQFLAEQTDLSLTTVKDAMADRTRPYPKHRERLASLARRLGLI